MVALKILFTEPNFLLFLTFWRGIGLGFLVITLQAIGLANMKSDMMNDASTVMTLTRYTFMGFGTALFIVITVLLMNAFHVYPVSFSANKIAALKVFHWLYVIGSVLSALAFYYIFKIKEDPTNMQNEILENAD